MNAAGTVAAPRPVFCVLDGAYRDLAVADDAVRGGFTAAGQRLDLGVDPDWTASPYADDKEWRIEWVKFYYALDLAHAFAETRDRRYVDTFVRLAGGFMRQRPPASDVTEVTARRIQNWIYAWNRLTEAGGDQVLDEAFAQQLTDYLWLEVDDVRRNLTSERNHRTLELYALLVAAVAFPHRDPGQALARFALDALHENLLTDVWTDGVHRECSTHYHCLVLRSFLGALRQARLAALPVPVSYLDRLSLACDFALHCHRPDGHIPACADSDSESYRDVLALAAELLDRDDLRWGASLGREGHPPARRAAAFPRGGYYVQRSGWGERRPYADERFLIFDCGPLGDGGHGHYDVLSVEIAADGGPLLVDPGRYTYAEGDPNWRHWFKGTAAHNTVTVDGLDQTPYARRKPRTPVARGTLLARGTTGDVEWLVGRCDSPVYDAVHVRTVLFVAGEYWVICDQLRAAAPHRYQLRWHLAPDAGPAVPRHETDGIRVETARVALGLAGGDAVHVEEGWYAPRYGVKTPAPVVVTSVRAAEATFVTVVDPRPAASRGAGLMPRVVATSHRPDERTVVDIAGTGRTGTGLDTLVWTAPGDASTAAGTEALSGGDPYTWLSWHRTRGAERTGR